MADLLMEKLLPAFRQIVLNNKDLPDLPVTVKTLTPAEAIGSPGNWDYPLLRGKEILIQASIRGSLGQAFTGTPTPYQGSLSDILEFDLARFENRAIFIAALNALFRDQNLIKNTIHCRDNDPEECGRQVALYLKQEHNPKKIGIAGYQPALVNSCIDIFGADSISLTDLSAGNLNKVFRGIKIEDGVLNTNKLIAENDLLLVTGSVFVNNTAEPFYDAALKGIPLYFFGTTVAGIAHILGLKHICPLGS